MLDAIGARSVDELFRQIPAEHRMASALRLPPALSSEVALERHLRELLSKNTNCQQALNFLGAGCWQHHVPAACEEIVRRREWLTSVFGSPMSDHGRNQAWFEFCSQLAELIGMEFVGLPVYSWGCAAGGRYSHGVTYQRAPGSAGCGDARSRAPCGHSQLLRIA